MSGKTLNLHDRLLNVTFENIVLVKDFLKNHLLSETLESIDLDTLEKKTGDFVYKNSREQFADQVYRVDTTKDENYVYFLFVFNNKSYTEEIPVLRLLMYYDKEKESLKTNLEDWIGEYSNPSEYKFSIYDLIKYSKGEEKRNTTINIVMKTVNNVKYATREQTRVLIVNALRLLQMLSCTSDVIRTVGACIKYILELRDDITEEELQMIAGEIIPTGSEVVMTVAEELRAEGEQRGIEEGLRIVAKHMIVEGEPIDNVMEYTRLTDKEIDEIKKEMVS